MREVVIIFLFGAIVGIALCMLAVSQKVAEQRSEAVERGYAEWVIGKKGKTEWRWKEAKP